MDEPCRQRSDPQRARVGARRRTAVAAAALVLAAGAVACGDDDGGGGGDGTTTTGGDTTSTLTTMQSQTTGGMGDETIPDTAVEGTGSTVPGAVPGQDGDTLDPPEGQPGGGAPGG